MTTSLLTLRIHLASVSPATLEIADPQILDLKGTPRNDQAKLLDIFVSVTSSNSDLSDSSFLTSIDMDPTPQSGITPSSSAMFSPTTSRNSLGEDGRETPTSTPKAFGDFRRLVSFATRRE